MIWKNCQRALELHRRAQNLVQVWHSHFKDKGDWSIPQEVDNGLEKWKKENNVVSDLEPLCHGERLPFKSLPGHGLIVGLGKTPSPSYSLSCLTGLLLGLLLVGKHNVLLLTRSQWYICLFLTPLLYSKIITTTFNWAQKWTPASVVVLWLSQDDLLWSGSCILLWLQRALQ